MDIRLSAERSAHKAYRDADGRRFCAWWCPSDLFSGVSWFMFFLTGGHVGLSSAVHFLAVSRYKRREWRRRGQGPEVLQNSPLWMTSTPQLPLLTSQRPNAGCGGRCGDYGEMMMRMLVMINRTIFMRCFGCWLRCFCLKMNAFGFVVHRTEITLACHILSTQSICSLFRQNTNLGEDLCSQQYVLLCT